ncbi:MAG TPA: polysaccharide deacetylase family protein [Candidatus Cloacimonetes bacterium]|nr:polysaccharide deacetylase family protein [Candidatus Cloacimonadota bacterium]
MPVRKLYKSLRAKLNTKQRSALSKLVFSISGKPFVYAQNQAIYKGFPQQQRGGFIISADFEMAWAFRYSKRKVDPLAMAQLERENIPELLKLFERYNIPITWATVGHLMLESCKKGDHDWMQRLPYVDDHWKYTSGDWFDADPYTDYKADNAWYAPDMLELILQSPVKHEIGCHTFSHIDCLDRNCPPQVLDDEIVACKNAAKAWDIELKSFVFPGGTAGNYPILNKHGFQIYRKNVDHDLAYPYPDEYGMLITPSTSAFGRIHDWSADYYIYRFKTMLDKAVKTNTVAHIWLHPSVDKWTIAEVMPEVLRYASDLREAGKLWIGTMGDIANHINGGE